MRGDRLHLAFVTDTWEGSAGGVVSARRLVEGLRAHHDVTVVVAAPSGEEASRAQDLGSMVALPPFYVPLARRLMHENGFVFAVPRRRVLQEVFRRVDVAHVQFPFWLGLAAVPIARAVGTPVVTGFHVQPENVLRNVGLSSPRLVEAGYRFLVRRFFAGSDAVVCPSPFAEEALLKRGLTVPTTVVSNGVGPQFRPGPDLKRPTDSREGRIRVAIVGRLAREKRLDVAIEGLKRSRHLARIELVVTGRGPLSRAVERWAANMPIPARIGHLADEELVSTLQESDLIVHASEVELEGMAVLEALACGTPALIARANASATTQFALGEEFLFAPGDPADLARRLDALIESPGRLSAARAICLARASAYRIEDSVRRMEAVYRGAIERGAAKRDDRWPGSTPSQGSAVAEGSARKQVRS